jgi:hypothetical protein
MADRLLFEYQEGCYVNPDQVVAVTRLDGGQHGPWEYQIYVTGSEMPFRAANSEKAVVEASRNGLLTFFEIRSPKR